jgi:hypothetical protein
VGSVDVLTTTEINEVNSQIIHKRLRDVILNLSSDEGVKYPNIRMPWEQRQ